MTTGGSTPGTLMNEPPWSDEARRQIGGTPPGKQRWILSHLGPWQTGPARTALYSLVSGPSDWATVAGIVALSWRAGDAPEIRAEVEGVFGWLRGLIPREGFTPWESALIGAWLGLGHADAGRQGLEQWRTQYEETLGSKNSVRALRRYGGMTLEQYARFCIDRDKIQAGLGYPGVGRAVANAFSPPPALVAICRQAGLDAQYPFIPEWQEALNASPALMERFIETKRSLQLSAMGVSGKEKDALDQIVAGEMDMHQRMAQAQAAQTAMNTGSAGDPDPIVFPGQKVALLSDYVKILKGMQKGDMNGAFSAYGIDIMSYGAIATAWGAKMAADPVLTEKFSRAMA